MTRFHVAIDQGRGTKFGRTKIIADPESEGGVAVCAIGARHLKCARQDIWHRTFANKLSGWPVVLPYLEMCTICITAW
ncbi:hypothetical protein [Candidatus Halocynthiibacter alkanivorans]|uniref:hypothetical protein n=1 Tax=Candidatus Halocynthiibacter alkanivorans TaxID=2267619 RepID=UPI00109D7B48|nr:hypothetical protein [Candidatus Halocynthiibacter alkanivorans]